MLFNSGVFFRDILISDSIHTAIFCLNQFDAYKLLQEQDSVISFCPKSFTEQQLEAGTNPYKPLTWLSSDSKEIYDPQQSVMIDQLWDSYCKASSMCIDTMKKLNVRVSQFAGALVPITVVQGVCTYTNTPLSVKHLLGNNQLPLKRTLEDNQWHLPFINTSELEHEPDKLIPVSVYRAYCLGNTEGKDIETQYRLGNDLIKNKSNFTRHLLRKCNRDSQLDNYDFVNYNSLAQFILYNIKY
jgi:hypothetical protein